MVRFFDRKTWIVATLTAIVVAAVFIVGRSFTAAPKAIIQADRASVIREIQALERLETSTFTVEKVIEAGTPEASVWQNLLFGDKLLLIAQGKVTAGFDLSTLSEEDTRISRGKLSIDLPAPVILSAALDNEATKVYDRQTGFLNRGALNLESQARQAAEQSIRAAACQGGILTAAGEQGKVFITRMFQLAGFAEVEVRVKEGKCE